MLSKLHNPSMMNHFRRQILSKTGLQHIHSSTQDKDYRTLSLSWLSVPPYNKDRQLPTSFSPPPFPNKGMPSLELFETCFNLISPRNSNAAGGAPWLARMKYWGPEESFVLSPFCLHNYVLTSPPVTGEIDLSECNVVELARTWSLLGDVGGTLDALAKKVVGGWNLKSDYEFAVLVQLNDRFPFREGGLLFYLIHSRKWVEIEGTFKSEVGEYARYRILDISYHNAKFYAFELNNWKVGVIDPEKETISMEFRDAPGVFELIDNDFYVSIDGCKYGVAGVYFVPRESGLYLVIQSGKVGSNNVVPKNYTMLVFNLKEETGEWERVASIGDEIFFIGNDVSFGVSSKNLPNWERGSMCLFPRPFPLIIDGCSGRLPERLDSVTFPEYWRYLYLYNMNEEKKGIVPFKKLSKEKYTGLFFPPPSWVKWRVPSLDNAEVKLHNLRFRDDGGFYKTDTDDDESNDE